MLRLNAYEARQDAASSHSASHLISIESQHQSDEEAAQKTLNRCQQLTSQVMLVKADVSKQEDVKRLIHESVARFHSLDVLINNAAKVVDKPILEMSEDDWDSVVDTNMKGTFLCSKYAATIYH